MSAPQNILIHFAQSEPPIRCATIAEMNAALNELHLRRLGELRSSASKCPLHVNIEIPGYSIDTGVGSAAAFVMTSAEPFDEFYVAVGDDRATGDDTMFYGAGQDSYWKPKHLLPIDVARRAVHHFVESQQRLPELKWEL